MKNSIQDFKDRKPFEVPTGYFEGFTDKMMQSLPEADLVVDEVPEVSWWVKMKPLAYLAAMFVGAALMVRILVGTEPILDEYTAKITVEEVSDEFIYDTVEQTFVDDYAMHLFLTNNIE